jgi:hypothetical protein
MISTSITGRSSITAISALVFVLLSQPSLASSLIDPFTGNYVGHATFEENGVEINRDLDVAIEETDDGFKVDWKVATIRPNKSPKIKEYSISFAPTDREHVFQAEQKKTIFGGLEPLDPMTGDPYVWARIFDQTLTVFALLINDDGGYELLKYDRSLVDNGLSLNFNRIKNGEQLRSINSVLEKQ